MSDFPETSYSLIERVHDLADEASWVEFLGIYQPVVYRMARRRGLQDADAQDVIQQVFASIARSIDGWKAGPDRPPFRAWLTTVSRNAITNALARRPRDRGAGSTSVVKATQIDRTHPGHVWRTHWKPTARVFYIGEPVVLQMTLTNAGQQPVSFYDGGMQRGSRNNQFDFICRAGGRGPALPDVGDPMNYGGMARKIMLQPEESLAKEVDITKWFEFKDKETYEVTGLFHLELQPVDSDDWRVLWDDIAVGQCQINIEPAAAAPAETVPRTID